MTRQKLNHGLSHRVQFGAQADKYLSTNAFAVTHQSEEEVLGADVVVA